MDRQNSVSIPMGSGENPPPIAAAPLFCFGSARFHDLLERFVFSMCHTESGLGTLIPDLFHLLGQQRLWHREKPFPKRGDERVHPSFGVRFCGGFAAVLPSLFCRFFVAFADDTRWAVMASMAKACHPNDRHLTMPRLVKGSFFGVQSAALGLHFERPILSPKANPQIGAAPTRKAIGVKWIDRRADWPERTDDFLLVAVYSGVPSHPNPSIPSLRAMPS